MYSFPYLEPVCCSMSSPNYFFLTCIQISQEAGQVVWYSHLSQNFPQFIVIHTVKGFGTINKAEIDVFLELSCFFHDPGDVGNLISGSSAFSKTSLNIESSEASFYLHIHGDCSHEIKRCLLLGRKVMTNLDSILKSRDITLSTKVRLVKAVVFPVVMYGCESWTVLKN